MRRMRKVVKRLLLYIVVIVSGLAAGYYSAPLVEGFELNKTGNLFEAKFESVFGKKEPVEEALVKEDDVTNRFISAGNAIEAVKALPLIQKIMEQQERETEVSFAVYQKPEAEKPLWWIKVSQRGKNEIPENWLFKVNALSAEVLNLTEEDLYLGGIRIGDTRKNVEDNLGKAIKIKKSYDSKNKQTVRTMEYEGFTLIVGNRVGVSSLSTDSPQYPTTRELRAGDAVEKLHELYGEPDTIVDGRLAYTLAGTDQTVFYVNTNEGKVTGISIEWVRTNQNNL